MSLTLTLQDDVAALLQAEAEQQHQPLAKVATTLLLQALTSRRIPKKPSGATFRVQPHPGTLAPGVRPDKLNRLADELYTEALMNRPQQ